MTSILKEATQKIVIETTEKLEPKTFFESRKGFYVFSDFAERILQKAGPTDSGTKADVSSFDLLDSASDAEIEKALPEKHVFSESEVCAVIANLVTRQPKGEEGTLLANGYANLFYTPSFVVGVFWRSIYGGWSVSTWYRDESGWRAGDRVFSPATDR